MEILIRNFLGVEEATIPLGNTPTFVSGPNCAGKTSLSTAIGALLARTDDPLSVGVAKRHYLREKTDNGEVVLRQRDGTEFLRWSLLEKGIRVLPDCPPASDASRHVLGLTNFITIPPKYRVDVWEACFLPPPRELVEMVGADLKAQIGAGAVVDEVVKMLRSRPWPECEAIFSEKSKEAKREWSRITGEPYGSKKADKWLPPHWRSELDAVTPAEASTILENAREHLRTLQNVQAARDIDVERGRAAAAEVPNIEKELANLRDQQNAIAAQIGPVRQELADIKARGLALRQRLEEHDRQQPRREETTPCPGCGVQLVVGHDRTLTMARDESAFEAQQRAWSAGRERLEADLENLRAVSREKQETKLQPLAKSEADVNELVQAAMARLAAAKRAAQVADRTPVSDVDQRRSAEAEQAVEDARKAVELIDMRIQANNAHINVANYSAIASALGPRGIRSRAMKEKMDALQMALRGLENVSGWPRVELDASYAVTIDGRAGPVCSGSEKWRANFLLQAAVATVLEEKRVIADGADILDDTGRTQFVSLVDYLAGEKHVYTIACATGGIGALPQTWEQVQIVSGKML